MKKPLYYVMANQGICVSQVEGLLPQKSPGLFEIAISMFDVPANLVENYDKSILSKDAYEILKAIKNDENPKEMFIKYGWKDVKKQKINNQQQNQQNQSNFIIFKGRRKEEGPFGQEYGLAWHGQYNICRYKYIDLSKDGYEDDYYNDFKKKMQLFEKVNQNKLDLLQVYKYQKDNKGIKIFTDVPSQGTLSDYINLKHEQGRTLTQKTSLPLLQQFIKSMLTLGTLFKSHGIGTLHIKNILIHNNRLTISEPLLITDKVQKKLRELKNGMDYFSPQLKQNVLFAENLLKLQHQKMDLWFFGFMMYKILLRQVPVFDSTRKPILEKQKTKDIKLISKGMKNLISRCLSLTPGNRPKWDQINLKQLQKNIVEDVQNIEDDKNKKEEIKLGTKKEMSKEGKRNKQEIVIVDENNKLKNQEEHIKQDKQLEILQQQQQQQQQDEALKSPKFRRFKLTLKSIIILCLYIFIFFRPFLSKSISMLLTRGYYTPVSIHLISSSLLNQTRLSTATILTDNPEYFMLNQVSFQTLNNDLKCINNNFNPIHDPTYEIITFVQSGGFLGLLLMGWVVAGVIIGVKIVAICKTGIGNRKYNAKNKKSSLSLKSQQRYYYMVYTFYQLCLSSLLFIHFYIFQFFYFSLSSPCFGIQTFNNIQPFFDSSLYIFFNNIQQFMQKIFTLFGILGVMILGSSCFYSWLPKLDHNNQKFFTGFSIILRILPYVLFILFCRVGVFVIIGPSAIKDQNKILQLLVEKTFTGLLGVIPEIFILFCVLIELGYEYFMKFVERKIMENNKLMKFFNLVSKKNKNTQNNSKLQQSKINVNDMSFNHSKHQLIIDDY